jgi:hypothetical protein
MSASAILTAIPLFTKQKRLFTPWPPYKGEVSPEMKTKMNFTASGTFE